MIGRFLIVVTFLEDALRILTQWSDQLIYLKDYRHSMFIEPETQMPQRAKTTSVTFNANSCTTSTLGSHTPLPHR